MRYNAGLKSQIEPLAKKYVNLVKSGYTGKEISKLEEQVIELTEEYAFSRILSPIHQKHIEDSKQEARIGILEALRRYDPDKGTFLTWVVWYVIKNLTKSKSGDLIHVPYYIKDDVTKYNKYITRYSRDNQGKVPSKQEILEELDIDEVQLKRIEFVKTLSSTEYSPTEALLGEEPSSLSMDVFKSLESLDDLSKKVITMYFFDRYKVVEISKMLNISPSRVSKVINKGLERLRSLLSEYII